MAKEKGIPDDLILRSFIITPTNKKQLIINSVDQIPSSSTSFLNNSPENQASLSTMNDPHQLPDEIVIEILIRLPVKSLIRFTSVCKSWKTLISDPQFVKKHLRLSAEETSFRTRQIIVNPDKCKHVFRSYSLNSLYSESITYATSILHTLKKKRRAVDWIIGSCSGLICIGIDQNTVCLWNPSIRKLKMLPHLDNEGEMGSFTVFGFGYDGLNDDYKVVAVYSYPRNGLYETVVKVYSLNANCWKRIQEFPHRILLDESGKYVNGTLNWVAFGRYDPESSQVIESFDLAKETYFEVPQPDYTDGCSDITLGVIGDCLCILRYYGGTRTDVWIMSEYGVKDSWNILVSLPYELEPSSPFQPPVPIYISESGEILIEYNSQLILFDPSSKTIRHPVIHDFNGCLEAVICIESLVLPYAEVKLANVVCNQALVSR